MRDERPSLLSFLVHSELAAVWLYVGHLYSRTHALHIAVGQSRVGPCCKIMGVAQYTDFSLCHRDQGFVGAIEALSLFGAVKVPLNVSSNSLLL